MDANSDDETFMGQVHHDQFSIHFCPEPGDIIIRKVVDHERLGNSHLSLTILATYCIAELYKDNFYAFPERCPDENRRAAYHRLFFRNGDHIIRRGRFSAEHNYEYQDEEMIRIWVYWPGYQLHSSFVRLISGCNNVHRTRFFEPDPDIGRIRARAQSHRFLAGQLNWEPGDLILRHFQPGPPGEPNPGWYRLLGVQQVDENSDTKFAQHGDILIKLRGRPEFPRAHGVANTRIELYCYVFTKQSYAFEDENDEGLFSDSDEEQPEVEVDIFAGDRWMYLCGDSMLFDFNDWNSVLRFQTEDGVPQPADIMISTNEQFTEYDTGKELGGFVKFYQNAPTSIDPADPRTIVFNPTRVPDDGATISSAAPPNLPRPELQAGWLEPNWDHLAVPVPEAAHPIVLRFGRWAEESSSSTEPVYRWIWNPYIEMFRRHPRSADGTAFFRADRTGVNYGENRSHPVWEEFSEDATHMHQWLPPFVFPILQGDCVVRRDLLHNVHPILTHGLLPCTRAEGDASFCPGDLMVRYGLLNQDPSNLVEGENRYHFGVELYVLVCNEKRNLYWSFRGRDQVIFGFMPKPKSSPDQPPRKQCRLQGVFHGSTYMYSAPGSRTCRAITFAVEGGAQGVAAKQAAIRAGQQKKKHERKDDEIWKSKNENPKRKTKPKDARKQTERASSSKYMPQLEEASSSSEGETSKENNPREYRRINVIEATRSKLKNQVIIPPFPSHETGNYKDNFRAPR